MPWGQKTVLDSELPEALRGKSPKEMADEIARLQGLSTELETVKGQLTERDTKLAEVNNELTETKNRIEALENGGTNKDKDRGNPSGSDDKPISFLDDEDGAFEQRAGPIKNAILDTRAQQAKFVAEQAINSNPGHKKLFAKYKDEYDNLIKGIPLNFLGYPDTYKRVFNQVLGGHLQELMDEQAKVGGSLFTEPASGSSPAESKPAEIKLTDDEKAAARKLGISDEQMIASKKSMSSTQGHISFAKAS